MAFAIIDGITVQVSTAGAVRTAPERIGSSVRAFLGGLLTTYRDQKRGWKFSTTLMLEADAETLEAAVANGVHVVCSGDILNDTVTCEVTVGDSPLVAVAGGFRRALPLTLREV